MAMGRWLFLVRPTVLCLCHDVFFWAELATFVEVSIDRGCPTMLPDSAAIFVYSLLQDWETMFSLNDSRRLGCGPSGLSLLDSRGTARTL